MQVSDADSMSQNHTSSTKTILSSTALKQNQRHEGSGRIIKSILTNKDFRQSQCSRAHSERQIQTSNLEREKQSTRPVHVQLILKGTDGAPENRITVHGLHVSSERQERRFRHKDRPDRGVWTSRSNGGGESLSSSASSQVDPLEGTHFTFSLCNCGLILFAYVKGERLKITFEHLYRVVKFVTAFLQLHVLHQLKILLYCMQNRRSY